MKKKKIDSEKILIMDSSALISYFDPFTLDNQQWIVPSVKNEIYDRTNKMRLEIALSIGKVKCKEPSKKYIDYVTKIAEKTGDATVLSETDIKLLALSKEFSTEKKNIAIVTDDYAIQNVAEVLNIIFIPATQHGIKLRYDWEKYCPGCLKSFGQNRVDECLICGTKLKRRVKRNHALRK